PGDGSGGGHRHRAVRWSPLSPDAARLLALGVAAARIGLGVTAVVAPTVVSRPWIGSEAEGAGAKVLGRSLGGRDVALGLGPVLADRRRRPIRGWVEAAALADLVDATATLAAFRSLPAKGRWIVLASAGGAAAAGALAAASL
ncbi:MAG: hypothetical protein ACRDYZ_09860, partial [Acidimicrobiales bacterium]